MDGVLKSRMGKRSLVSCLSKRYLPLSREKSLFRKTGPKAGATPPKWTRKSDTYVPSPSPGTYLYVSKKYPKSIQSGPQQKCGRGKVTQHARSEVPPSNETKMSAWSKFTSTFFHPNSAVRVARRTPKKYASPFESSKDATPNGIHFKLPSKGVTTSGVYFKIH